jgi:hypothetical protein
MNLFIDFLIYSMAHPVFLCNYMERAKAMCIFVETNLVFHWFADTYWTSALAVGL